MHERGAEMMMLCCVRYKGCLITTPINDPSINDHIMVIAIIFWEGRGGNRRARNIKARVVFSCVMMTRLISLSSGLRVMLVAADLQNPFIFLGLHFSQRAPCWLLIRVIWWVEGAFTLQACCCLHRKTCKWFQEKKITHFEWRRCPCKRMLIYQLIHLKVHLHYITAGYMLPGGPIFNFITLEVHVNVCFKIFISHFEMLEFAPPNQNRARVWSCNKKSK